MDEDVVYEEFDPDTLTDFEYETYIRGFLMPNPVERIFVCILLTMMIVGVIGNCLVVVVVISKRSMWSSMNIFLTNLAVADLLILTLCLPPTNTSVYVSILSLVFITLERWKAITSPLKRQFQGTRYVIVGTWLTAMIFSSPEPYTLQLQPAAFVKQNFTTTWGTQCKETWSREFQKRYQLIQALITYLSPLILISFMCFQMSRTLNYCELTVGKRHIAKRKKAVRMLGAVVFLFTLSYLPVHLYNLAAAFEILTPGEDIDMNMIAIRKLLPRVFSYSSSCLNPLLYNFMCGKFRKEFARVVCCRSNMGLRQSDENSRRTLYGEKLLCNTPDRAKCLSHTNSLYIEAKLTKAINELARK